MIHKRIYFRPYFSGMKLTVAGFDWVDGNHAKCQKHGVSIAEIEALFRGVARVTSSTQTLRARGPLHRRGPSALRRLHTADSAARPADPCHLSQVHARQGDSSV